MKKEPWKPRDLAEIEVNLTGLLATANRWVQNLGLKSTAEDLLHAVVEELLTGYKSPGVSVLQAVRARLRWRAHDQYRKQRSFPEVALAEGVVGGTTPSADNVLQAAHTEAEFREFVQELLNETEERGWDDASLIIMAFLEGSDTPRAVIEATGLTRAEYRAALKRMRRLCEKLGLEQLSNISLHIMERSNAKTPNA